MTRPPLIPNTEQKDFDHLENQAENKINCIFYSDPP